MSKYGPSFTTMSYTKQFITLY